jgi:hypothetical protein
MDILDTIAKTLARLVSPDVWTFVPLPVPATWEAWAIITAGLLVSVVLLRLILRRRRPLPSFKLAVRNYTLDEPREENIVVMRREDAELYWPGRYPRAISRQTDPLQITIGGRAVHIRLRLNQQQPHLTLDISPELVADMKLDTRDADKVFAVNLGDPWWRLDKKTFDHPNPDVRLQWNVGLWFLILGIFAPKAIEALTDWFTKTP